ncbi:MAG: sugar kinase [Desulfobulbaceae bacterium BRH_c16a]|nr:MAG: sugar kinase [Desulfobulbaceae bacterium BRH_c16a]
MIDLLALGEVMLRFDPGPTRIALADSFKVWEGGGEYNVARGLSRCFGRRTAVVTALVDNAVGQLVKNRIAAGGVDTGLIRWLPDDGIGESRRNGIYFLERGFGLRPALGVSDRGHSAVSQLRPGEIDWQGIFAEQEVRWFHSGGIMAGLSPSSPAVIIEAMTAAKLHGATVSYDLNYRPSLWQRFGGKKKAEEINQTILPFVDVMFGVESLDAVPSDLDPAPFRRAMEKTAGDYPGLSVIATTMRIVQTATCNDWGGLLWHKGRFYEGIRFPAMEILDRVGGGDAFAAGIIHGLLSDLSPQKTIDYGVVHGALTMTTPGDNSMFTLAELDRFLASNNSGVVR